MVAKSEADVLQTTEKNRRVRALYRECQADDVDRSVHVRDMKYKRKNRLERQFEGFILKNQSRPEIWPRIISSDTGHQ
jgi:hypothetical protein